MPLIDRAIRNANWPMPGSTKVRAAYNRAQSVPGCKLHPLKGKLANHWAVWLSGNWRLTFTFANGNAELVDYQDYH